MTRITPEAARVHRTDLQPARSARTEVTRIGRQRPGGGTWRFTLAGAIGIAAPEAHAYLDPGAGSMLLQVLLGGLAGVGVLAKLYWYRVRKLFARREGRKREEQEGGGTGNVTHGGRRTARERPRSGARAGARRETR